MEGEEGEAKIIEGLGSIRDTGVTFVVHWHCVAQIQCAI